MSSYTGFENMMQNLSKHIDESAISRDVLSELEEAKESLLETKNYYFQQLILYTEIKELLLQHNYGLPDQKYEDQNDDKLVFHLLSDTLSCVEAKQCLNISMKGRCDDDENLFGLSTDYFEIEPRKKKVLHQNLQQTCIPLLEQRLKNKSLEIFRFWNPTNQDSEGLALAKTHQLATTIDKEKKHLLATKKLLKEEKLKYKKTFQENYQKILHKLKDLEEEIKEFQEKPNIETTKITSDWLATKCDYLLGKLKIMNYSLYADTYTNETVAALRKVRYYLDAEMKRTKTELQKTKESLQIYESVGGTFKEMLTEYTRVTMQIDNKKWALFELQKNK